MTLLKNGHCKEITNLRISLEKSQSELKDTQEQLTKLTLQSEHRKNEQECNISDHQNLLKMHQDELKYKNDEHVDEV